MTQSFKVSLRAGEKVYLNGAVLRVDRKVTLELLNDVTFLLGAHVLQVEDATTPLRQLYFVIQTLLMEPGEDDAKLKLFWEFHKAQCGAFKNPEILKHLESVGGLVDNGRYFEAMRTLRKMFAAEDEILADVTAEQLLKAITPRSTEDGSRAA